MLDQLACSGSGCLSWRTGNGDQHVGRIAGRLRKRPCDGHG
jgi:hypothetical protein